MRDRRRAPGALIGPGTDQQELRMQVDKDVYVPMRDGVAISMDIYRPDGDGSWPVVLVRTPYIKAAPDIDGAAASPATASPRIAFDADGRISQSMPRMMQALAGAAPAVTPFVAAGYVVIMSDSRGTGYAEGDYDYYNVEGGPYDGYDTVEWIAQQPWCDGNVGMWGLSGSGVLALAAAVTAPPHLKALVAAAHPVDFYRDQWYPGGVLRYQDRVRWPLIMEDCIAPLDPGDPSSPAYERKRGIYERRYRGFYDRMLAGRGPINLDWATEGVLHTEDDEFWQRKSLAPGLPAVTAPTLVMGVLHDHFIGGTVRMYGGLSVQKRLIIVPASLDIDGVAGDGGLAAVQVAWFDHFLKGVDNGVADGAPVRIHLAGAAAASEFAAWPPPAAPASLYLAEGGALDWSAAEHAGAATLIHDPADPNRTPADTADQRSFDAKSAVFTTAPLDRDTAVVGLPQLRVHLRPGATDSDLCIRISDVQPDGSARLANTGALRVRAGDGSPQAVEVELVPIASLFKAGHRIRLAISAGDYPFCAPNPNPSQTPLLFGAGFESALVLPVIEQPPGR
jgi:putative CocE/NonD family hydrolase